MSDDLVDEPGDAVCWLHQLCPECGAMPSGEQPERCWRCGALLTDKHDDVQPT
jgi:ribosomal protein S27AE